MFSSGDVYIKAYSDVRDIDMVSFSSTNPIARNDNATTDQSTPVDVDVLSNDSDSDGDALTVSLGGPGDSVVVADYTDDFQTAVPTSGWQYLWNENGAFGDVNNYSVMPASGTRYRPPSERFLSLGAGLGHPGSGVDDGVAFDGYAIAAYTVAKDGVYSIEDSSVSRAGRFGDGVGVMLHVGNAVTEIASIGPESAGDFDTSLGFLTAGTTIYIGVGPDGPGRGSGAGNDAFRWDFSIVRQVVSGNGQFMVNSDQSVTYTPNPGFVGTETINYQVSDGRGGLNTASITVTTLAVEDDFLLGDVNQDGVVNFLDIGPFIVRLQNLEFQDEADINGDGAVNFLDIAPFIVLLSS